MRPQFMLGLAVMLTMLCAGQPALPTTEEQALLDADYAKAALLYAAVASMKWKAEAAKHLGSEWPLTVKAWSADLKSGTPLSFILPKHAMAKGKITGLDERAGLKVTLDGGAKDMKVALEYYKKAVAALPPVAPPGEF